MNRGHVASIFFAPWRLGVRLFLIILLIASPASARTITVTAEDCDQMAFISSAAPRLSWAMSQGPANVFGTQPSLHWHSPGMTLLMRLPITELVPPGQRITKAELTIAPHYVAGTPSIQVRRVLAEWGTGVCHQYRMTYPQKLEWAQPGGRGAATDRTAKDSAVFKIAKVGEHTVDLTEDVELWYTGGAANRGWILSRENNDGAVYFPSPYSPYHAGGKQWKLQITFEPK